MSFSEITHTHTQRGKAMEILKFTILALLIESIHTHTHTYVYVCVCECYMSVIFHLFL